VACQEKETEKPDVLVWPSIVQWWPPSSALG